MSGRTDHSPPPLIRALGSSAPGGAPPDLPIEPVFLATKGRLRIDTRSWTDKTKAYFAHAVTKHPEALRTHVQRIELYATTSDPAIIGALCDLFLVLGENGKPLRRRMLALARPMLSTRDHHALHRQLEAGHCDPAFLQSRSARSMLCRGITGATLLITKQESPGSEHRDDPLESARQQMESGHPELARETLERALQADPGRRALHLSLLEIYRHTRDRRHALHLWQSLESHENPALNEWRQLLTQLDEEIRTS